jgi:hypothetical protein
MNFGQKKTKGRNCLRPSAYRRCGGKRAQAADGLGVLPKRLGIMVALTWPASIIAQIIAETAPVVLIFMAVNTEIFPVGAVRGVILGIPVLVMHR